MNTFDFRSNRVVGYVDIYPNGNASIEIVGYCDVRNEFYKFSDAEVKECFIPRGRVFAHNFAIRHYDMQEQLACFIVRPNEKEGDNFDQFVWDKSEDVYKFGYSVSTIRGILNDDSENNYNVFVENDLIESDKDKFVYLCGKIYHIKSNSQERVISYWFQENLDLIQVQGKKFIPGFYLPPYDGAIDIKTDDQLIDWYIKKILKKQWPEILKEQNFKFIEPYIREILLELKDLDPSVLERRMQRLKKINMNFVLTIDELKHISDSPWLSKAIDNSLEKYKNEYLLSIKKENREEIERLKVEHNNLVQEERNRLENEMRSVCDTINGNIDSLKMLEQSLQVSIEDKKLGIEIADVEIKNKREEILLLSQQLDKIQEKKNDIIDGFAIVREVLGMAAQPANNNSQSGIQSEFNIESIDYADNEVIMYQAFKKSLENTFKKNNMSHIGISAIGDQIAAYNILLVPDVSVAKVIILSALNCSYMTEYVSASWKSFDDLWINGLGYMFRKCEKNPERLFFLILQNINLTYLPNYMQPLIDLQSGIMTTLPRYGCPFPENMRIICTLTDDVVMPLNAKCLKYIGCINPAPFNNKYCSRIEPSLEENLGFLNTANLLKARRSVSNVSNFYTEYINEE